MKILMTGATSFTGKHLLTTLLSSGDTVFHLVRNKRGIDNEFLWNFKDAVPKEIPACDVVIHLAAYVDFSMPLNVEQYHVNTISTLKLSAYAKSSRAYFILASMSGVHGTHFNTVDEETPIAPETHYALSKYLAEEIIKTYVDDYSILRLCGIYGINGPAHLGLNRAITSAVNLGIVPVLNGSGEGKRNYICVLDAVLWILHLIKQYEAKRSARSEKIQETLYLAGPEIMTIEQYLQMIVDVILPEKKLVRMPGKSSSDMIVKPSPAPFKHRTFKEYLSSLAQ